MKAQTLVNELLKNGYENYTGVPCSIVKPLINYVIDSQECNYLPATIEGEATSIAAGGYLAGKKYVVMLQNSGLGNIVNPLTSLTQLYKTPALFIVTWRGEPGKSDALQHKIMGEILLDLLKALRVSYSILEDNDISVKEAISNADREITRNQNPYFLILKKGLIEPYDLKSSSIYNRETSFIFESLGEKLTTKNLPSRDEATSIISKASEDIPVISSTGFTSRSFYNAEDRDSNFYMQGSMGFALPIALGLSNHYKKTIFCIDGDASCIMRLGGLFTAGTFNSGSIIYFLLDNNANDSTGGQATISSNIKFEKLFEAAGFDRFIEVNDTRLLLNAIQSCKKSNDKKISAFYIRTSCGMGKNMDRPKMPLDQIANRFSQFIRNKIG
jgi:phosphonopyruvate decarboxylase